MTDRARAAVALLVIALTGGCDDRDAQGPGPALPDGPVQTFEVRPPPPPVSWGEDGFLSVTTYGSSSCPTGPTGVELLGAREVEVGIEPLFPGRDPCTADISPRTTEVPLPRGVSADEELTVRLHHDGGEVETVVLPPAGR